MMFIILAPSNTVLNPAWVIYYNVVIINGQTLPRPVNTNGTKTDSG
jgi:hypothetical protein